jgi:hypothetical protein
MNVPSLLQSFGTTCLARLVAAQAAVLPHAANTEFFRCVSMALIEDTDGARERRPKKGVFEDGTAKQRQTGSVERIL